MNVPLITYIHGDDVELGYYVGTALDELVAWARANGCSESELEERLEESFDRYEATDA